MMIRESLKASLLIMVVDPMVKLTINNKATNTIARTPKIVGSIGTSLGVLSSTIYKQSKKERLSAKTGIHALNVESGSVSKLQTLSEKTRTLISVGGGALRMKPGVMPS